MTHPDDLKIDISEIFGGDVSEAREVAEKRAAEPPAATETSFVVEEDVERDLQFPGTDVVVGKVTVSVPEEGRSVEAPVELTIESEEIPSVEPVETLEETSAPSEVASPPSEGLSFEPQEPIVVAENIEAVPFESAPEAAPETPVEIPSEMGGEVAPEPVAVAPEAPAIDFGAFTSPFVVPPPVTEESTATPASVPTEEAPAASTEAGPDPAEVARLKREGDYHALYDQFRHMIRKELIDLVGEKKAHTMLTRTLEATRNKFPEYFRNANWDAEGNLLEDGSMDAQRLIQNKAQFDGARADQFQDLALKSLLNMRLMAIDKGLGTATRTRLLAHLKTWCSSKTEQVVASGEDAELYRRLSALLD